MALVHPRPPSPEPAFALPDCVGSDVYEGTAPESPQQGQPYPEQSVEGSQCGSLRFSFYGSKILLLFGLYAIASLSAGAQDQDKVELFGGFSYMRFLSSNLNGWEVSGQYKFLNWLGGVADVDEHYGSIHRIGTSTYTYLFGAQVSLPSRVSPFGHLLLGGAHNSTGGFGSSSFSMAFGGGIDAELTDAIHWRLVQMDYLLTQFGGGSQLDSR